LIILAMNTLNPEVHSPTLQNSEVRINKKVVILKELPILRLFPKER